LPLYWLKTLWFEAQKVPEPFNSACLKTAIFSFLRTKTE